MKLQGFRCDNCGIESRQKQGRSWTEVRTLVIGPDRWSGMTGMTSDGLHYCCRTCLLEAMETKWEKER